VRMMRDISTQFSTLERYLFTDTLEKTVKEFKGKSSKENRGEEENKGEDDERHRHPVLHAGSTSSETRWRIL